MASAPLNPTALTPPRVDFIDPRTGAISREWYRFFLSLLTATQTNQQETELAPDAISLLASYDAMLANLAQYVENQPDSISSTASLEADLYDLRQTTQTQPRAELGTLSAIQQDNVPWLQFNTQPTAYPTGPAANGTVYWDDADAIKTLNIVMEDSGEVIQHVGEETYYRVKATANITKGQVVMFTGTVGASGGLRGAPATGLTAFQNEYIMGVATQDIATNNWGYVTWFGEVKKINTTGALYGETWVDGDILYYNPAFAGGLTKTAPVAPNPKVIVASVVHAATNGILFVRPTFGSALGATDSNVEITSVANGDLLQYDGGQSRWENVPASTLAVGTATNLAGGAANRIPYQTASSTTSFITAPTVANTYLEWSGSAFQWSANPLGTVTSVNVSGGTTGLTFSGGPITSSGTITMAGTLDVDNGGTGTSTTFTAGSVVFAGASGVYSQNNAQLFWDNTNQRLGIGVATPGSKLDILAQDAVRVTGFQPFITLRDSGDSNKGFRLQTASGTTIFYNDNTGGGTYTERMRLTPDGFFGIGTNSPQARLDVNGDSVQRGGVYFQMTAPGTKSTAATLTGAEVVQGYIEYTGTGDTLTLPTGTNLQAAMPTGVATLNNIAFDFTIINTGSGTATLAVNTGITSVGALTTAAGTATTFRIRKTATNTFIVYRT